YEGLWSLVLLSAAVWHVVQHGLVDHYGMLEEFVTMVTELVPELMSYRQKAQLIMGLRARVSNNHGLCLFYFTQVPCLFELRTTSPVFSNMQRGRGTVVDSKEDSKIYKCVPFMSGSVFGLSVYLLALTNYSCLILDPQEGSFPALTDTKVPWSDEETMNLLDIWGKDSVQRALKGCLKNRHIFTQISQNMAERGFMRTVEQCQTRIKRLKKYFRQNNKGNSRMEYRFYEQLERVLGSSAPSTTNEITYDIEEINDDDESQDGDEDLQFLGTRSVPWTDLETLMAAIGFSRTPEQCQTRLKRLKSSFRQCYQNKYVRLQQRQNERKACGDTLNVQSAMGVLDDRKKVLWSDKETIILLEIWGDPQVNNNIIMEILHFNFDIKLSANGYSRSAEQCHSRIKRLKANYRQCQENMSSSGTDRIDFKFYDLLEQILDKQPSTSSTVVTDPIEISEDSEGIPEQNTAPSSWSDEETLALIDVWGEEDIQRALRGFVHNGYVYAEISQRIQDLGFSKTSEQCRWKVKALRNNFRQCYEKKKSGRKVEYRFYKQLEQILGQEAVSIDEYDEKDEQVDQDSGTDVFTHSVNTAWTDQETVALIEVWAADDVQHGLKTCVHNSHIFAEIAEKLASLGYLRPAEQCHTRIKRTPTADTTLQPFMDKDPDMCKYNQSINLLIVSSDEQLVGSHLLQADMSRKTPWSEQETRTLLEIWGEDIDIQLILKGSTMNKHIYSQISEVLAIQGYLRTPEQCQNRIKRLKANLRQFLEGKKWVPLFIAGPLPDDAADGEGKESRCLDCFIH
uniref:Myb-like domain-containing protein n=1 Tax=Mola mola TaxID=94237 RepID=A0A3Q3W375_MOLML